MFGFRALPRHSINLSAPVLRRVCDLIFSGKVLKGVDVEAFQEAFAGYVGSNHALSVYSARLGLYLSIKALGLREGDEVIVAAYNFHIVPVLIKAMGIKPVFVDIDPDTYNIDPSLIEAKVSEKTKAILATHLFGQSCRMDKIMEVARKHNLKVIEDCAHSCGAEYKGQKVGTFGDLGVFSFAMGKTITCFGGGMIVSGNKELAEKIAGYMKDYAYPAKSALLAKILKISILFAVTHPLIYPYIGYPLSLACSLLGIDVFDRFSEELVEEWKDLPKGLFKRFTNLQAAVGTEQLKGIDARIASARENAFMLSKGLGGEAELSLPKAADEARHIYFSYRLRLDREPGPFRKALLRKGIDTKPDDISVCPEIGFFQDEDASPYSAALGIKRKSFGLPCSHFLEEADIRYMIEKIREVNLISS